MVLLIIYNVGYEEKICARTLVSMGLQTIRYNQLNYSYDKVEGELGGRG